MRESQIKNNQHKLCKNCKHLKSKLSGAMSETYWCGLVGDGYQGTSIGIYPWLNKPHPKCPLKEDK